MGLETVTHISDLNPANPTAVDPKSEGDNHIRNIKTALLNSFAGFDGAVLVTGTDGGAVNAYTLTPSTALTEYSERTVYLIEPTATNTAAATLSVSGLSAKAIKSVSGADLAAGDLVAGAPYAVIDNGTEFRLLSVTKNYIDQLAFSEALPAQSVGFVNSNGTTASFTKKHTGYAQDEVKGANIASAATVNLQSATGNLVHITGTTGITAITLDSGAERTVIFDGVLTLTHSASLLLPGGANITTAANDRMTVRGDTAGAIVTCYERADGTALAITAATGAEIKTGTSNTKNVTPAGVLSALGFSAYAQTADQTITSPLTIAHGLGRTPAFMQGFLKCTTAELGYSVGDIIPVSLGTVAGIAGSEDQGVIVRADATNIYLKFGDNGSAFAVIGLSGVSEGESSNITNANWKFFLRVLA